MGPEWLFKSEKNWPKSVEIPDEEVVNSEKRKSVLTAPNDTKTSIDWYYQYFSSYAKIVRMVAWIIRFSNNLRKIVVNLKVHILNFRELKEL